MTIDRYVTIHVNLASESRIDVQRALALLRDEIAIAGPEQLPQIAEMLTAFFYVDTLDRPDLVPELDEAVDLTASLGEVAIPVLLEVLDAGDMKAQIMCGHALGRIGTRAIGPLMREYTASKDPNRKALILYALGKVKAPEIIEAAPIAIEAAVSPDMELRDTAVRALGKFVECTPPGGINDRLRQSIFEALMQHVCNPNPSLRAKAVRSLGKLARYGHIAPEEQEEVRGVCRALLGLDAEGSWDRAYIVRKEATEALRYCDTPVEAPAQEAVMA